MKPETLKESEFRGITPCDFHEVLKRHEYMSNYDGVKNTPISEYHKIMAKYHSERLKKRSN